MSQPLSTHDSSTPYSVFELVDTHGQLSPQDLGELPGSAFTALDGMHVRKGFTHSTVWLRVLIRNQGHDNLIRWLELSSPLLEHVHLFRKQANGLLEKQDQVDLRKPAYRLDVPANSMVEYFIQIKTRTSMSTQVHLWSPEEYLKHETLATMGWSLMYGSYLTLIIFYLFFWIWSKEKIHLYYFIYILVNFLAAFLTEGWLLPLVPPDQKGNYINFIGILISMVVTIALFFSIEYLKLNQHIRRTSKFILMMASAISTASIIMILEGYYSYAAIISQISSITAILFIFSVVIHMAIKKVKKAYFFIFAFMPFYIGVTWRYLRNMNFIESGFWNDNTYQFGAFVHMTLLSVGIFASYSRLRHERNRAQFQAQAEHSLRSQQDDFMTMLSHETKTPLSVILASADNIFLSSQLDAQSLTRVQKIVNAAKRIQDLLTRFIERERYLNAHSGFAPQLANLSTLAALQAKEMETMHDVPIVFENQSGDLNFFFDPYLIKIAISNLLENAIFHSEKSGLFKMTVSRNGGLATISISDQGPGIPEHELPHILSRFYRGSTSKGHGLGLYLVDQIAKRHGGHLQIENHVSSGCMVSLTLPIVTEALNQRP